ncbi:MAG: valine--tRNA ligase [Ruminococcaceae bacterium]|nr:valine--tRNA ligase [Oscillospiraceae bacterium]
MAKELNKVYNPKDFEDRLYAEWTEKGYFTPSEDHTKKPFSIVIPPPNVTGQLHMGHALNNTLQDIIIRTKRMQGYNALWVPGTDHAGIATQIKVEEDLRVNHNGLTRYDLGREEFLKRVWEWKGKYGDRIISQLKKLGSSCDWTRERFTMDETCSKAVKKTFITLFNKGLIYKGYRIINWCPKCATALSDAEVDYKELDGNFWHIRYPIEGTDDYMIVATTRPETMLGDTGIAVHPEDERYAHLVGKYAILPLVGRRIPIVADEYVDKEFGTGCVKMTPCHDPNDFEVGKRHNLEQIKVIDEEAKINKNGGVYEGLDRYEARKKIVEDLEKGGYLVKVEPHVHNVGHCYRCKTVVEPTASEQWFVSMKPLAKPAIDIVKSGELEYIPERFAKIYLNWMENIQDWCISRQLWWGHRIPVYYCQDCGEIIAAEDTPDVCPKCGCKEFKQEEDVLDTWFSSALWPFSTLGWPEKTTDLEYFYPTNVLVTAYDIITFWVSKMIFSALEFMDEKPFKYVLIHGLVRDEQGRKMSKSLGNGIDPLEIVDQYGADALRFTLATGNSPGNDMRFSEKRVEASRNFANKIWNAARFIMMNLDIESFTDPVVSELEDEDKWILNAYNTLVSEVTENIDKYELGIAVSKLYDFIWDVFCDWYIELVKPRLNDKGSKTNAVAQNTIVYVFSNTLKLLHPIMPFITEEIWLTLPHEGESIMISAWPVAKDEFNFAPETEKINCIIDAIKAIRNRRAEMNVAPSKKAHVYIETANKDIYKGSGVFFEKLASASGITLTDDYSDENSVTIITDNAKFYIPLNEMLDFAKELERLTKEKEKTQGEIDRIEKKLSNQAFVAKAPAAVVAAENEKLEKYKETLANILSAIERIK